MIFERDVFPSWLHCLFPIICAWSVRFRPSPASVAFWEAETPVRPIANKGPFVILFGSEFSTTKTEQQEPSVVSFASKLCKALDRAAGASVHPALHFTEPEAACEALRWMVDVPFLGFLGGSTWDFLWRFPSAFHSVFFSQRISLGPSPSIDFRWHGGPR